jgi:hypothetical protein
VAAPAGPPSASPTQAMARDIGKVLGFGCLGMLVVLIVVAVMIGRSSSRCPPVLDTRAVSPDSAWDAAAFHFECGFGRKGTASVSIVPVGELPTYPANLLTVMDSSAVDFLLGRAKPPALEMIWEGPDSLLIRYPAGVQVISRLGSALGIQARYEARE